MLTGTGGHRVVWGWWWGESERAIETTDIDGPRCSGHGSQTLTTTQTTGPASVAKNLAWDLDRARVDRDQRGIFSPQTNNSVQRSLLVQTIHPRCSLSLSLLSRPALSLTVIPVLQTALALSLGRKRGEPLSARPKSALPLPPPSVAVDDSR